MRLAGESQRHHRPAMKRIFKCDHARAPCMCARNLDPVLDGLGAGVKQQSFLTELAWRDLVQAFGKTKKIFVRRDRRQGVQKSCKRRPAGGLHTPLPMPTVHAPNPTTQTKKPLPSTPPRPASRP